MSEYTTVCNPYIKLFKELFKNISLSYYSHTFMLEKHLRIGIPRRGASNVISLALHSNA